LAIQASTRIEIAKVGEEHYFIPPDIWVTLLHFAGAQRTVITVTGVLQNG
jgi:hypothetical protein